jgi:hypothetical protein
MDDEDWDESEPTSVVECDRCGDVLKCKLTEDPYIAEVHPEEENEMDWWCYSCWDERKSDV